MLIFYIFDQTILLLKSSYKVLVYFILTLFLNDGKIDGYNEMDLQTKIKNKTQQT